MQKITYTTKAKQLVEGNSLLEQASKQLEQILGQSADLVEAQWDQVEDERGRTLYELQLSDWTGKVTGKFSPADLRDPTELHYRLWRLWGDLLQVRSHHQLQELTAGTEEN